MQKQKAEITINFDTMKEIPKSILEREIKNALKFKDINVTVGSSEIVKEVKVTPTPKTTTKTKPTSTSNKSKATSKKTTTTSKDTGTTESKTTSDK